jgi:hypothetical protein
MKKFILVVSVLLAFTSNILSQVLSKDERPGLHFSDLYGVNLTDTTSGDGPRRKINLRLNNATLDIIFTEVQKRYPEYSYKIDKEISTCLKRRDIDVRDASPRQFLDYLEARFPTTGLTNGILICVWLKTDEGAKNSEAKSKSKKETPEVKADSPFVNAAMNDYIKPLDTVFKNGLQEITFARATGAYSRTNENRFQYSFTEPNIIDRVYNVSVPFPKNNNTAQGAMPGSLRGAVSLYGNRNAQIIVNNFGYHNHTDFINPMDIADITFIKDAAGGAIWGINSGNGVMALTTKTGIASGMEVNLISSMGLGQKPDLNYLAGPDAATRIAQEKQAYDQYRGALLRTPVTDIITQVKNRTISQAEGDSILASWSKNDVRKEIKSVFYRPAFHQMIGVSVSTGEQNLRLYASFSTDKNLMTEKGNSWNRKTAMANISWTGKKIEFTLNPSLASIYSTNNFIDLPVNLSYLSLYDAGGRPRAVPLYYPVSLTAGAAQRGFLNWDFNPVEEARLADNSIMQRYYQLTTRLRYNIIRNLYASVSGQYGYSSYEHRNQHVGASFYTRDLVNLYRQTDSTGMYNWPIPSGDILDEDKLVTTFQNHRGQIDYKGGYKDLSIMATGGLERRAENTSIVTNRVYGNNIDYPQSQVNYASLYQMSVFPGETRIIPYRNSRADSVNNFFGYYASTYLTWRNRYTLSGNYRPDFTNRFNSLINNKGIGLWSVGGAWQLSEEEFMKARRVKLLKLRTSFGVNGNFDYNATPFRIIQQAGFAGGSSVVIPATPMLGWEKIYIFNTGIDFISPGKWLSGSIDYYHKRGKDLLHNGIWNPTTGISVLRINSGSLKGSGIDVSLQTKPISLQGQLTYNTSLLLAYSTNKVTSPEDFSKPATQYLEAYNPVTGYPVDALFALPFAGFNSNNGAPMGYLKGLPSEEYTNILSSRGDSVLKYVGSAAPVAIANMVHSWHFRSFTVSMQLSGKFGYYTRVRPADMLSIFNIDRQTFYQYSTANIVRADNIRLQQVQLAYDLNKNAHPFLPVTKLGVVLSVNNLGFIYRANNRGIDPDVSLDGYPAGRNFTITIHVTY